MKSFIFSLLTLSYSLCVLSQTPVLSFDCTKMPEVCTNMCWGVHCTGGKFSAALTFDNANTATKRARRTGAGCLPSPNRCSTKSGFAPGNNCDEYPFASTKEADAGGQNNRCVPTGQNSAQGGTISAFYSGKTAPLSFNIAFASPTSTGVKFCTNTGANVCTNDGNIFVNGKAAGNPTSFTPRLKSRSEVVPSYLYKTRSGQEMSSPALLEVGQEVHTYVARDEKLERDRLAGHPEAIARAEADSDHYVLVMDEIVERLR